MKASWQTDKILCSIVEELQTIYNCHIIVLYGSRARGDFKSTSDYDVAGFTSIDDKKWIARFDQEHQVFHDIFIFPEKELAAPNDTHLQMSDGIVILDHNDIGKQFLETLKSMESEPLSITDDEIQARKGSRYLVIDFSHPWLKSTRQRAKRLAATVLRPATFALNEQSVCFPQMTLRSHKDFFNIPSG